MTEASSIERFAAEHRGVLSAGVYAVVTVLGAVFPRTAYRLRWRSRLSLRGHVIRIVILTAVGAAVRTFMSWIRVRAERYEVRVEEFRRENGALSRSTRRITSRQTTHATRRSSGASGIGSRNSLAATAQPTPYRRPTCCSGSRYPRPRKNAATSAGSTNRQTSSR